MFSVKLESGASISPSRLAFRRNGLSKFFRELADNFSGSSPYLFPKGREAAPFEATFHPGKMKLHFKGKSMLYCSMGGLIRKAKIEPFLLGPEFEPGLGQKRVHIHSYSKSAGSICQVATQKGVLSISTNHELTRARLAWLAAPDGSELMRKNENGNFHLFSAPGGIIYAITPTTLLGISPEWKFSYPFAKAEGGLPLESVSFMRSSGNGAVLVKATAIGGLEIRISASIHSMAASFEYSSCKGGCKPTAK